MKFLLAALILCSSVFAHEGNLFQAVKGEDTIYVCGTIHLIPKNDLNSQDNIRKVLNDVDSVYFEVLSDNYESQQLLMPYLSGDSLGLNTYLDSAELRQFETFYQEKLGSAQAMSFPPLVNFFMLFQVLAQTDSLLPMDFFYMKISKGMGKGLEQLETTKEQFRLIESISKKDLIEGLTMFVSDYQGQREQYYDLLEAYQSGDHSSIQQIMDQDSSMQFLDTEAFLDKRNEVMLQKMVADHQGKKVIYFIGMAHLIGEKGILEGLEQKGYTLKSL